MAEHGFAPLSDIEDPRAEMLSRFNVGGVVSGRATVVGLPPQVWGKAQFGIVPSSHSVRLMIVEGLDTSEVESGTEEVNKTVWINGLSLFKDKCHK
jgi:hypothetical protein